MRKRLICAALILLGLTAGCVTNSAFLPAALADDYPLQGQSFVMDGVVSKVDIDRDRVTFTGDNGRQYTLDTSASDITLIDGNQAGMTGDLKPGMRVHVSGKLLSAGIAEVEQMRVLDDSRPPRPRPTPHPQDSHGGIVRPAPITLRGTVDTVDTSRGTFVVQVRDKAGEHTRTILLADNTDVSGMALTDPAQFPVKPGDRVTVAGALQPDGTVLAGVLSLSRTVVLPTGGPPRRAPLLLGRVSSASNRYTSRDIKIRLDANGEEVRIKVPRGISIRSEGHGISVHDLREGDELRVTGAYDGSDFRAARIEVLLPPDETR